MQKPMPPPDTGNIFADPRALAALRIGRVTNVTIGGEPYLHWDRLRHRQPPDELDHELWWALTKFARRGMQRTLPLHDGQGQPFVYVLPDEVLREIDFVASHAKGQIELSEQVTDPATRDRYLVGQLIEEAITSSQLEGASTSRRVARDMIRSGRRPRDRSETMILNNFHAMRRIGDLREERLTTDLICEIHRIVTEGTLDNPDAAGRFQRPDEDRIQVCDDSGQLLHSPPPAAELPARIQAVCDFANGDTGKGYLPGVLRAITVHFMIGYEHPFEDGNGRTARALFYWSMLNQGYWLTEFLSVSRILKRAPVKYALSYLYTESDDNDLTYFYIHHLDVIHRAIVNLNDYLSRNMAEVRTVRRTLKEAAERFNPRQLDLLQHALRHPDGQYTVKSHQTSHVTATETARSDLVGLERLGLLTRRKSGKRFVFEPVEDLAGVLRTLGGRG